MSAVATAVPTSSRLPSELWKKVVLHLRNDDLKSARLVNSTSSDLSTPLVFGKVVLSMHERNIMNLHQIARMPELRKHVKEVHIDLGSYVSTPDMHVTDLRTYVANLEHHFVRVLDLPSQCDGPLSVDHLFIVLVNELAENLGPEYLSGIPRSSLLSVYTSSVNRTNGSLAQLDREGEGFGELFQHFLKLFENVSHVETVTQWTEHEDSSIRLASYLMHHLPAETIQDIRGFQRVPTPSATSTSASAGLYAAPGATARALDFMSLGPGPALNGSMADQTTATFVQSILRTLSDNEIKLQSLSLPGSDAYGVRTVPQERRGMIASPAFVSVEAGPDAARKNLLLPTFRYLKVLELHIDPISDLRTEFELIEFSAKRLCRALHAMPLIKCLSLGFSTLSHPSQKNTVPTCFGWTLHDTLLIRDCTDEEANMTPEMADRLNGNPYHFAEYLHFLAATKEPGAEWAFVNPYTGQETAAEEGVDYDAMMGITPPRLSSDISMRNKCKCWGFDLESAMQTNPWPKLKHLSLWNMATNKADLVRLVKTVASSLRSLELVNVHFAKTFRDARNAEILFNHCITMGLTTEKQPRGGHEPLPGEAWLDAVQVMAQSLDLQYFKLELGAADELSVVQVLRGEIFGFRGLVQDMLSAHVLNGQESEYASFIMQPRGHSYQAPSMTDNTHLEAEDGTENENDIEHELVEPDEATGEKTGGEKKHKKKKRGKKGKKH